MNYSDYAIHKFEEQLDKLKEDYIHQCHRADDAFMRLDNWNKDEEIAMLRKQIDNLQKHILIHLSDKELEAHYNFMKEHYEKCALPLNKKNVGNTWIYTITGTGIGMIIQITCPICGGSQDITSIKDW